MIFANIAVQAQVLTGFNQAWTGDDYGRQWIERFDLTAWSRAIQLTQTAGGKILRVWLFEGHNWEGLQFDSNGNVSGLDPVKLENIRKVLALAQNAHIKIYLTLFDGNVPYFTQDDEYHRTSENRYRKLFSNRDGFQDYFLENALKPLLESLNKDYREAIYGIDIINEMNATVNKGWFENNWDGANQFMRRMRIAIRSRIDTPITASFGHLSAAKDLMSRNLDYDTVDFLDIHSYDDRVEIPYCISLQKFSAHLNKPLILGEFAQFLPFVSDSTQTMVLRNRIQYASKCGFSAVLAWRLEEYKSGERRFSFVDEKGQPRPAFWALRDINLKMNQIKATGPQE